MNILEAILEHKREEVRKRKRALPPSRFYGFELFGRQPLPLGAALDHGRPIAVIAEIKRTSPSAGVLRAELRPADIARSYASHGAAAISVLTDGRFFSGSVDDLAEVRRAIDIPVLRKDFIIDEYQLLEARAHGADAVLLIAGILDRQEMRDLLDAASALGLSALVEVYDRDEIGRLDFESISIVGINNRDLRTFAVDLHHTVEIASALPPGLSIVSESGIRSSADLRFLRSAGIRAALIGESLMKEADPGSALASLLKEAGDEAAG